MKTNHENANDVIYSVDSKKLTVKVFRLTEKAPEYSSTFEDFNLQKEKNISIDVDKLPQKVGHMIYFRTKDDAQDYIKIMIGM